MKTTGYLKTLFFCCIISSIAFACSSSDSENTKKRVLDKPAAEKAEQAKAEPALNVEISKIASDPKELEKLWIMPLSEVTKRLSSYKYKSKLTYSTKTGDKGVTLTDNYEHTQAKNGDMHFKSYNDKVKKFELYFVDGIIYDRMAEYPFREQPKDGKQNFWMEKMYAGLITYYQYFRGFLKYGTPEATTFAKRPATKIPFTFDENGKMPEEDLKLKFRFTNQYLLSARSFDHLANKNRKMVSSHDEAKGFLIVDNQTGALVAYEFHGVYRVKVNEERIKKLIEAGTKDPAKEITFTMNGTYNVSEIDTDITIKAPKSAGKIERRKPALGAGGVLPKGVKAIKVEAKEEKKN